MDDRQVDEVVRSIASGSPVDWDTVDTSPADGSLDEVLRELRVIAQIAEVHGTAADDSAETALLDPPHKGQTATWGPLTLLERIGRGAFADVYRAHENRLDREVALKLLRGAASGISDGSAIVEEGRLLAKVRHPNIVTVYGADRIDGRVGMWMEFIEGRTLEQVLQEHGPLSAHEAALIGIEVCRGLSAVHRAGLVHRDVKAQNVMRESGGRIVLMDFGAGRQITDTATAHLAGTPLYVAPEILDGSPATPQSDLYSVGVLLYHLVSGDYPIRAATLSEIREAHRRRHRILLSDARPDLPRSFVDAVEHALAPGPEGRFESAGALEKTLSSSMEQARSSRTAGTKFRGLAVGTALAAIVAALTVGLGVFSFSGRSSVDDAQARLGFKPSDLVLITRFENRTGESVFDGAVEYALQRGLSGSDVVGLVPDERIDDALRLMKRPPGTVIDRTVGREVAVRDGHIKALLAGRIERFGSNYVITAQLIDPADDSVVATIGEEAAGQQAVLAALRRQASRVRVALGEQRNRIRGADPNIEPAATESLQAFQLYNQAYQLGRQGKWQASLEVVRQVVAIDPEFASGWIWLAWAVRNTQAGDRTLRGDDPHISHYREFAERALRLANRLPEWERHWVTGSYHSLLVEDVKAIPHYEALLKLRPDHYYAYNNLLLARFRLHRAEDYSEWLSLMRRRAEFQPNDIGANTEAAMSIIMERANLREAQPYLDRLRERAESDGADARGARFWLDFVTAYALWYSGELKGTLEQVRRIATTIDLYPPGLHQQAIVGVLSYYLSLGRLADASQFATSQPVQSDRQLAQLALAIEAGDGPELRRLLTPYTAQQPLNLSANPSIYVRAGMLDRARQYIARTAFERYAEIARGQLLVLEGRRESAISPLEHGLDLEASFNDPSYYEGCEALADALWQVGRPDQAIASLEACSRNNFKLIAAWAPLGAPRMSLDLHLADLYSQAGRTADAQEIEQRVRTRLALADDDFPLLRRLESR